jgi:hypothetical protein
MAEVTHRLRNFAGLLYYQQIVTPRRLREILDEDGSNYERPEDFYDEDEWNVEVDHESRP